MWLGAERKTFIRTAERLITSWALQLKKGALRLVTTDEPLAQG